LTAGAGETAQIIAKTSAHVKKASLGFFNFIQTISDS
jgi:hypothetical protein